MRAVSRAGEERDFRVSLGGYAEAVITRPPATVRGAGLIVAIQGATGVLIAAVLLIRAIGGADQRVAGGADGVIRPRPCWIFRKMPARAEAPGQSHMMKPVRSLPFLPMEDREIRI